MKARMYWVYATRSLTRGGQRSLLAIFCVAVGVMAIVALQLVSDAINQGLTGDVRAINGGDVAITSSTNPLTASQVSAFDQLQAQGAITSYTAVDSASGEFHLAAANGVSRFFLVDAVDPHTFPLVAAPTFTSPSGASLPSLLHGSTVVITATLAQTLHLKLGDTERLYMRDGRATDVTVGAVIQNTGMFQGSMLLINLADYAALPSSSGQPVTYSAIYADVPGHTDSAAASAERLVQARFPLATIQTTKQAFANNQAQVQQVQYFLQMVGLLALLIGGVGIVNTMQVLLSRRRIEIAVLKTAGYRRGDLYALFGAEAGLIGLVGGVIGALAGIGASELVKGPVQQSLQIVLPATFDPLPVGAGVVVGLVTALIFGLLPIVRAGQAPPLAVLRESAEGAGWRSRLLTGTLLVALIILFFGLALSILRSVRVAALAVGVACVALIALGLLFGAMTWLLSKLPVYESFRWRLIPLLGAPLVASIALTIFVPAFGALCLAATLAAIIVATLPRSWKANVRLALRNIGRQKARTVTTLLALYIGVFSIGLILVLGQNITAAINSYLTTGAGLNSEIIASGADKATVERQLAELSDVHHETVASFTQASPVAVNGEPIGQFVAAATASGKYTANDVAGVMNGAQGYDFSHGAQLDTADIQITSGRALNGGDAGARNALLPQAASQAPNNLKLGATVTLVSQADRTPITLTVVGFYSSKIPQFAPILTDGGVVTTLSAGAPTYGFRMHLDAKTIDATLAKIQTAAPNVLTYNFTDFADQYAMLLNNLITVLVAVTSLAMLASVIIIANAVALAMLERRRELGILKALCHTSQSVLGEALIENGIVGFTSALLALVIVVVAATAMGKLAFNLTVVIPTPTVLAVVAASVVVCMAVAATVALRASRLRPVEALRYE
ncbi:MAG TPA: FtsX-like permease family protein [Ktedonobacterales bacterium]|nr:FtsX-like permease family protein [Ktedonobacterales bacterium]